MNFNKNFVAIKLHLISFFSIFIVNIIKSYYSGNFILEWPGKQVISSIMYIRGNLQNDLIAEASFSSPYQITAHFLSSILPSSQQEFIVTYILFALILKSLILWLSVYLIFITAKKIQNTYVSNSNTNFNFSYYIFYLIFSLLISVGLSKVSGNIAGWPYPMNDSLNPSGISFFLVLVILIYYSRTNQYNFLLIIITVLATMIHPVATLFIPFYFLLIFLIDKINPINIKKTLLNIIIFFISWGITALLLLNLFPQYPLDNDIFFNIYIKDRHPHHYLPSFYFNVGVVIYIFLSALLLRFLIFYILKNDIRIILIKLWNFSIILFIFIHTVQFFGVEVFKINVLITLGISRISSFFVFMYLLILFILISSIKWDFLNISYSFFYKIICRVNFLKILATLLCSFFTISYLIFINHLKIYPSQPEFSLGNFLNNQSKNYVVLNDTNFDNLREVGSIPIYIDYYFPFSKNFIYLWSERLVENKKFFNCLNQYNSIKKCRLSFKYSHNLYLITHRTDLDISPIFSGYHKNAVFFIYKLQ